MPSISASICPSGSLAVQADGMDQELLSKIFSGVNLSQVRNREKKLPQLRCPGSNLQRSDSIWEVLFIFFPIKLMRTGPQDCQKFSFLKSTEQGCCQLILGWTSIQTREGWPEIRSCVRLREIWREKKQVWNVQNSDLQCPCEFI